MNPRVRTFPLFIALFALMTLMLNYNSSISEIRRGSGNYYFIGAFFGLFVIAAAVFILVILIGQGDFVASKRLDSYNYSVLKWVVYSAVAAVLVFSPLLYYAYTKPLPPQGNATVNKTLINGTYHVSYYNKSLGQPTGRFAVSNPSLYLYGLFAVFAIAASYTAFVFYRDMLAKRRIKRLRKKVEAFDMRLREEGIDFLGDPDEAVVKLYKNAVLWLEILGIPYKESWTHWEHADRVRYKHDAFIELTKLFEKARYAPERVTREDAYKAHELYMKIRGGEGEG
ncbi:DUF4129 domain-containing protein [Thermococcus atlanticus]